MSTTFKQCCFTRLGGQGLGSGWQTVACSPGLSPKTQNAYSLAQNANVPSRVHTDANSQPLSLLEILGMEEYLCLSRIQYGLTDALGRQNNLFSHSFLFPLREGETVQDPNTFLTVSNENFKVSEEEARTIPTALRRLPPFDLAGAMSQCGLDQARYQLLIQCVFLQRFEKRPLYLVYSGSDLQLRALLYCIYASIPFSMRRTLAVASAPVENLRRNLIISAAPVPSSNAYLNVTTGENNVITRRSAKLLENLGFVDYFPAHWKELEKSTYFQKLEQMAVQLGDTSASDHTVLKIAHSALLNLDITSLTGEDLNARLYDALNNRFRTSKGMGQYILALMAQVNHSRTPLVEAVKEQLDSCAAASGDPQLIREVEDYDIHALSRMAPEAGAKLLSGLDAKRLSTYAAKLLKLPGGAQVLDCYYAAYPIAAAAGWDELEELINLVSALPVHQVSYHQASTVARELYIRELSGPRTPMEVFASYRHVMAQMITPEEMVQCDSLARDDYWGTFHFSRFNPDKLAEYRAFYSESNPTCLQVHTLVQTMQDLGQAASIPPCLKAVSDLAVSVPELANYREHILRCLIQATFPALLDKCPLLGEWYRLAMELNAPQVKALYALDNTLANQHYTDFLAAYQEERANFSEGALDDAFRTASEIILQTVCRLDSTVVLSLDIWLVLGLTLRENPYQLLEGEHLPAILECDAPFVCSDSTLIAQSPYLEFGNDYAHGGGLYAKVVRDWMNEVRKRQKKQAKRTGQTTPLSTTAPTAPPPPGSGSYGASGAAAGGSPYGHTAPESGAPSYGAAPSSGKRGGGLFGGLFRRKEQSASSPSYGAPQPDPYSFQPPQSPSRQEEQDGAQQETRKLPPFGSRKPR